MKKLIMICCVFSAVSCTVNNEDDLNNFHDRILKNLGTDNDQNAGGYLHLFNPSSTTFVKHFISRLNNYQ